MEVKSQNASKNRLGGLFAASSSPIAGVAASTKWVTSTNFFLLLAEFRAELSAEFGFGFPSVCNDIFGASKSGGGFGLNIRRIGEIDSIFWVYINV
jgi:hypothetical protein